MMLEDEMQHLLTLIFAGEEEKANWRKKMSCNEDTEEFDVCRDIYDGITMEQNEHIKMIIHALVELIE